jgi:hypothetical protein
MKNRKLLPGLSLAGVFLLSFSGCGKEGALTERVGTVEDRDLSGIAGPRTGQATPAARVPRGVFGTARTLDALAFPGLNDEERKAIEKALEFFVTEHTAEEGVGPVFNQNRCLGCHLNADDIPANTGLLTVATTASRAGRTGPTDYAAITKTNPPLTAAFTLFGDYSPASGGFDPLAIFGGPIQHIRTTGDCEPDIIPPESIDPNLQGGIDPVTGTSQLGFRRAVGERAAPPYIGRGLIEAIYAGDIPAADDPNDTASSVSSLLPPPGPECPGDCISGRHNENSAAGAFVGGDPVIRVSRFGLRAAGPTLFQFMIGGTQGEIGMTSPFSPLLRQSARSRTQGGRDPGLAQSDPDAQSSRLRSASPGSTGDVARRRGHPGGRRTLRRGPAGLPLTHDRGSDAFGHRRRRGARHRGRPETQLRGLSFPNRNHRNLALSGGRATPQQQILPHLL